MFLFVCFDLVICSRIDGFFGISTFSVLILVFHKLGILCMRVILKKISKSPSLSAYFSFSLLNVKNDFAAPQNILYHSYTIVNTLLSYPLP